MFKLAFATLLISLAASASTFDFTTTVSTSNPPITVSGNTGSFDIDLSNPQSAAFQLLDVGLNFTSSGTFTVSGDMTITGYSDVPFSFTLLYEYQPPTEFCEPGQFPPVCFPLGGSTTLLFASGNPDFTYSLGSLGSLTIAPGSTVFGGLGAAATFNAASSPPSGSGAPEPGTVALLAGGLAGIVTLWRRGAS